MTRTATTTPAGLDDRGFPLVVCGRCGGSGQYSWNAKTGTRCFGCEGKGVTYTPAVLAVRNAYTAALTAFRKPEAHELAAGDVVYGWDENGRPTTARTIAAVAPLPLLFGDRARFAITFADGTVEVSRGQRFGRRGKFDGQPYRDAALAAAGV